jgi:hypothetical protein
MSEVVIERVMDRQCRLRRLGQAVEVGQYFRPAIAQLVIELAAGT